jgi:probable phosphoglycerate mutase
MPAVHVSSSVPHVVRLTLHLVRHGQSEWNELGRLQGQVRHVGLTELGRWQARAAARALAGRRITRLVTSDLVRAVQTARPIAAELGFDAELEPGLREQSYGWVEGMRTTDAYAPDSGLDWADPTLRIGGGESVHDVYRRVGDTLARRISTVDDGGELVMVSHGDTISVAMAWLAGRAADDVVPLRVPNGSITSVHLADGRTCAERTVAPALN